MNFFQYEHICAAYLSTLDYLGEVNWERINLTKKWYALIKSRPAFRDILEEKLFTIPASKHYKNLIFNEAKHLIEEIKVKSLELGFEEFGITDLENFEFNSAKMKEFVNKIAMEK